jgi:2,5-dihydroxypyridine 5,6-dioxygenase
MSAGLLAGAAAVFDTCVAARRGETVLIITDDQRPPVLAEVLRQASNARGCPTGVITLPSVAREPPGWVAHAMRDVDIIVAPTTASLFHSAAAGEALKARSRLVSLTELTEAVLAGSGMRADFAAQIPTMETVRALLNSARKVRVTTAAGTDLTIDVSGRDAMVATGLASTAGTRSPAPDQEVFVAPLEEASYGVVVVDGSASRIGLLSEPVRLTVEAGQIVSIEGGTEADAVRDTLYGADDPGALVLAEFGLGMNPDAEMRGSIVEDEGVYGTAHVGVGDNTQFTGGRNAASLHLDYVFHTPTVTLDGVVLMRDGVLNESTVGTSGSER